MLIVNADDWGRCSLDTKNASDAFRKNQITSVSAMVFMAGSEDAALEAVNLGIPVGLHLNLTEPFTGDHVPQDIASVHLAVSKYLKSSKFSAILYNPFLRQAFKQLFESQFAEFVRLYGDKVDHINGHQHFHLCSNVLFQNLLPSDIPVRRNFTFRWRDRPFYNVAYRRIIDCFLKKRHLIADEFYTLPVDSRLSSLGELIGKADDRDIEIMVHSSRPEEREMMDTPAYAAMLASVPRGTYSMIKCRKKAPFRG